MTDYSEAIRTAFVLLVSGDTDLWEIIFTSFSVSVRAILIAAPLAVVVAFPLAFMKFPGRHALISLFHTFMAVPTVVIGLTLYLFLSRSGPLGDLKLLFTQNAMIIGQILLSFPLLVSLSHSAFQAADERIWETAITLGAKPWRAFLTLIHELRFGLMAAVVAGFGRIISEIGCSMMVGGNIQHYTRNIPTAIGLETSKGEFSQGIALGMVLLTLALTLNVAINYAQNRDGTHA